MNSRCWPANRNVRQPYQGLECGEGGTTLPVGREAPCNTDGDQKRHRSGRKHTVACRGPVAALAHHSPGGVETTAVEVSGGETRVHTLTYTDARTPRAPAHSYVPTHTQRRVRTRGQRHPASYGRRHGQGGNRLTSPGMSPEMALCGQSPAEAQKQPRLCPAQSPLPVALSPDPMSSRTKGDVGVGRPPGERRALASGLPTSPLPAGTGRRPELPPHLGLPGRKASLRRDPPGRPAGARPSGPAPPTGTSGRAVPPGKDTSL